MPNTVDTSKEAVDFARNVINSFQIIPKPRGLCFDSLNLRDACFTIFENGIVKVNESLSPEEAAQGAWSIFLDMVGSHNRLVAERDQLRWDAEEAQSVEKHTFEGCTFDLSGAGYLCLAKQGDKMIAAYDEGSRVFYDEETGNIDACGLHILSNSALEKKLSEARDAALEEAAAIADDWKKDACEGEFFENIVARIGNRIRALKTRTPHF